MNIAGALLGVLQLSYRIEQERERRADDYFSNPRPERLESLSKAFQRPLNRLEKGVKRPLNGL